MLHMTHNSRLAVSVHMLAYLAYKGGSAVSSAELASSVGTHPVVIRRLLSRLNRSRFVGARKGASGGFALGRPPAQITLLDVYRSVEPDSATGMKRFAPNHKCPVGARIVDILTKAFDKAQAGMEAQLATVTIAEIEKQLRSTCPSAKASP